MVKWINRRKIKDTKMQMAIIQNPHVKDPKILWKTIDEQERELNGKPSPETFDTAGFENLKGMLSRNPRFIVKS